MRQDAAAEIAVHGYEVISLKPRLLVEDSGETGR